MKDTSTSYFTTQPLKQIQRIVVNMGKRSKRDECATSTNNEIPETDINDIEATTLIVLPGDNVMSHIAQQDKLPVDDTEPNVQRCYKLGNGLRYDAQINQIYATQSGRLMQQYCKHNDGTAGRTSTYYVEPHRTNSSAARKYQPAMHDRIVGVVVDRIGSTDEGGGDLYRIDIHAAQLGILSNLQFTGATKRNKPILQTGHIVYCRVLNDTSTITASNTDEPILLSCMNGPYDVGIPDKDWTTKETCYGELRNGGTLCRISRLLARDLLSMATPSKASKTSTVAVSKNQNNIILEELSKHSKKIPFEVAIGMNGYVWINSIKPEYIILIQNAIQNSHVLNDEQIRAMVKNLIYIVDKQLQQLNDM